MPIDVGRAAALASVDRSSLVGHRSRPIATGVIDQASISGVLHGVEIVMICIALTLAELLAVALLVAPRTVARKLLSLLRALLRRAARAVRALAPPREPARPTREGA
jgi:hypothetical protein